MRLQVANIETTLEALRQKSSALKLQRLKARTPGVSTPHAHLIVSPEKSPIQQVEWFSRRRIATQARPADAPSPVVNVAFRTPSKESSVEQSSMRLNKDQISEIARQLRAQVLPSMLYFSFYISCSPHCSPHQKKPSRALKKP